MNPYLAAGLLEAAHVLGVTDALPQGLRGALATGLLGYGAYASSQGDMRLEQAHARLQNALDAYTRERALRLEREEELRRRDQDGRVQSVLHAARAAHTQLSS